MANDVINAAVVQEDIKLTLIFTLTNLANHLTPGSAVKDSLPATLSKTTTAQCT